LISGYACREGGKMGNLEDWLNFVKTCIADDNINLIAHRLYHLETEKEKLREALEMCRITIEQSLPADKISE
jgi:hypothetical protein